MAFDTTIFACSHNAVCLWETLEEAHGDPVAVRPYACLEAAHGWCTAPCRRCFRAPTVIADNTMTVGLLAGWPVAVAATTAGPVTDDAQPADHFAVATSRGFVHMVRAGVNGLDPQAATDNRLAMCTQPERPP